MFNFLPTPPARVLTLAIDSPALVLTVAAPAAIDVPAFVLSSVKDDPLQKHMSHYSSIGQSYFLPVELTHIICTLTNFGKR